MRQRTAQGRNSPLRDDEGSSPVEFVLVGGLLTLLTLGVLQLGLAIYVRNVVHDAAVEGAHFAALADTSLTQGAERSRLVIDRAVGSDYAEQVDARYVDDLGVTAVEVRIVTTLPLAGLIGLPRSLEVTAHAPVESLE